MKWKSSDPTIDLMERDPSLNCYYAGFVIFGRWISLEEAKELFPDDQTLEDKKRKPAKRRRRV
jgi:hypothetical protein